MRCFLDESGCEIPQLLFSKSHKPDFPNSTLNPPIVKFIVTSSFTVVNNYHTCWNPPPLHSCFSHEPDSPQPCDRFNVSSSSSHLAYLGPLHRLFLGNLHATGRCQANSNLLLAPRQLYGIRPRLINKGGASSMI